MDFTERREIEEGEIPCSKPQTGLVVFHPIFSISAFLPPRGGGILTNLFCRLRADRKHSVNVAIKKAKLKPKPQNNKPGSSARATHTRGSLRGNPRTTQSARRAADCGFPLRWRSKFFYTQKLKFLTKFLHAFAKKFSATAESPTAKPGTRGRGLIASGRDDEVMRCPPCGGRYTGHV